MREPDFGEVRHVDGISPGWPVRYDEWEPYYAEAERMYVVHGKRGTDPTEPWASGEFPHPAVSHEPRMAELAKGMRRIGLNPFPLPIGIFLNEQDRQAQLLHPLQHLRRLPLPGGRQGRR